MMKYAILQMLPLTFRTLFRTSEAILEEPPVEGAFWGRFLKNDGTT
jgi:hypothetical protein